jgi:hypothetical protein
VWLSKLVYLHAHSPLPPPLPLHQLHQLLRHGVASAVLRAVEVCVCVWVGGCGRSASANVLRAHVVAAAERVMVRLPGGRSRPLGFEYCFAADKRV